MELNQLKEMVDVWREKAGAQTSLDLILQLA